MNPQRGVSRLLTATDDHSRNRVPDAPILEIHWPVLPSACLNLSRDTLGVPQERTGRPRLCMLETCGLGTGLLPEDAERWDISLGSRPGLPAPADQRALADNLDAADLSQITTMGAGVRVKVERIRGGRRLPDVEYIETRAPRRPQTDKREHVSFRDPSAQVDGAAKLRLPWKINRRSD
jgi:hypothetical protein